MMRTRGAEHRQLQSAQMLADAQAGRAKQIPERKAKEEEERRAERQVLTAAKAEALAVQREERERRERQKAQQAQTRLDLAEQIAVKQERIKVAKLQQTEALALAKRQALEAEAAEAKKQAIRRQKEADLAAVQRDVIAETEAVHRTVRLRERHEMAVSSSVADSRERLKGDITRVKKEELATRAAKQERVKGLVEKSMSAQSTRTDPSLGVNRMPWLDGVQGQEPRAEREARQQRALDAEVREARLGQMSGVGAGAKAERLADVEYAKAIAKRAAASEVAEAEKQRKRREAAVAVRKEQERQQREKRRALEAERRDFREAERSSVHAIRQTREENIKYALAEAAERTGKGADPGPFQVFARQLGKEDKKVT
ncbi:hypothetical protein KIPB_009573 [Kipferlia bialata]|uniref:Trichohyalin-plectin-homology domain-containing protein n=1 Tax=Kipferlia bialata TaxID=797122 RepID=A0A9K3CUT0_9EUKA|nr:hypothetical protein KIPB_003664 [Kipferlia bialata]GIQ87523.1 hypothetical protein KIPB_009573 [Kipferlia bialata]|eukprot:g3664.t1